MGRKVLKQTSEKEWYYGELSDHEKLQNGMGVKIERDGSIYYGSWEEGLRAGNGVLCEADGRLVAGEWVEDKSADKSLMIYQSSDIYTMFCGKLENGKPIEGTMICSDGKIYHGIFTEWNKDHFNGEGTIIWTDERIYAGRWKNRGTDIGGVIRRPDGRMTGTLSNVRDGYAAKSWQGDAEKHFFYGKLEDEEARNADGILIYTDGEFYAGKIKGGQKTGFGIYRSPDQRIYIGEWDGGVMQGNGICVKISGGAVEFYVGEFKNTLYSGLGCLFSRINDKWNLSYCGTWKEGEKNGEGVDGSQNVMNWEMGTPNISLEQVRAPGPMRSWYDKKEIVSRAIFNSLENGEEFGDEKCFVGIRADADAPYQRTMQIEPGCDYELRVFYHNNADGKAASEKGTARETKLRVFYTKMLRPGESGVVSASLTSEGCSVPIIWDGIEAAASEELNLNYKIASARIYNKCHENGRVLPQTLFTDMGTSIGEKEMDGKIPPGSSGYVTFILHASGKKREGSVSFSKQTTPIGNTADRGQGGYEAANKSEPYPSGSNKLEGNEEGKKKRHSRISVKVLAASENGEYGKLVSADIGEVINVKIIFTNNASIQDIRISIDLPSTVEPVSGTSVLELSDGTSRKQPDDWIVKGLGFTQFPADGEGEIRFGARYFPDPANSSENMKIRAEIDTAYVTMNSELVITER